ncbi:hypothetical protein RCG17_23175 [Neobacillus sp. PS3-12]|uniref:hypothetical protein n=1 Tax=Neobacillus sp. PS3-12 TaxID=3070677 RepID=UPI0027DEF061|nr:hypothetical protein [Neobacillus sp. PS3-12]WML52255.1 hypothetical protein RCG17_23175 [Neobacillus sp. PS3-12]
MGNFNFRINQSKKVFDVTVAGSFNETDALNFINQYKTRTATIKPTEYIIDLDCTELNVTNPDVVPMLEQCYKMYRESGFSKVSFKIKKNPILKMQLSRIARNTQLKNFEIVEV